MSRTCLRTGWAQEAPPARGRKWLITGSVLSALIFVAAILLTWRLVEAGTAFDAETGKAFGIIFVIDFALAGIGVGRLSWRARQG